VRLNELGPRQMPALPIERRIAFVDALSATGIAAIEVASFSSEPALAATLLRRIRRAPGVEYAAQASDLRGAECALDGGVDTIRITPPAGGSGADATPWRWRALLADLGAAAGGTRSAIDVTLARAFGDAGSGGACRVPALEQIGSIADLGITRVTLADGARAANPLRVDRLCSGVRQRWPQLRLTLRLNHDRGIGLANALAALNAGVEHFDAALVATSRHAGQGRDRLCTADLHRMLEGMGFATGIDRAALLAVAAGLTAPFG